MLLEYQGQMHQFLLFIGYGLTAITVFSVLFYAPFARSWQLAFLVPVCFAALWSIARTLSIILYKEEMPPMIGFLFIPLFYGGLGCILRAIKLVAQSLFAPVKKK